MIKTHNKLGIKSIHLNIIHIIYEKPTDNIYISVENSKDYVKKKILLKTNKVRKVVWFSPKPRDERKKNLSKSSYRILRDPE